MRVKLKTCGGCDRDKPIWKNYEGKKYCLSCWIPISNQINPPKPTKTTRIKPASDKLAEKRKEYKIVRDEFLKKHVYCQVRFAGCGLRSTEVHHMEGKIGDKLLDVSTFKAVCRPCHQKIENNPALAKTLNLSSDRLTVDYTVVEEFKIYLDEFKFMKTQYPDSNPPY